MNSTSCCCPTRICHLPRLEFATARAHCCKARTAMYKHSIYNGYQLITLKRILWVFSPNNSLIDTMVRHHPNLNSFSMSADSATRNCVNRRMMLNQKKLAPRR